MKPFDPTQDHRVLMPEGPYNVYVAYANERVSKSGNTYLSLGLKVTGDSPYKNRIIWRNFFLEGDPESYATQRSGEELAAICRVTGINTVVTSPEQLMNGTEFIAHVQHYKTSSGILGEDLKYAEYRNQLVKAA